jgi:hypothetical protein
MSLRSHTHLKLIGAVGATALAIGTVAAPAIAAPKDLTYNCSTGTPAPLGAIASTFNPGKIPAKLTAGQSVKRSMKLVVHLSQTQTGIAQTFGTSLNGKINAKGPVAFKMKIPDTAIPPTPGATMDVTATGPGSITAAKAGSFKVNAGTINATLNISGGASPLTATQTCSAPTGAAKTLGTIAVSKDKTKTAASASYSSKKHTATGTAKVKSHFGLVPTGKVTFTLKKGSHTVKTAKGTLNKKGVATVSFKGVTAKGNYSIGTKYAGDKNLKGSTGTATFKV